MLMICATVQLAKALTPIVLTELGSDIQLTAVQPLNAPAPTVTNVEGSFTVRSFVAFDITLSGIEVSPSLKTTCST